MTELHRPPRSGVRIACIGIGGQGRSDRRNLSRLARVVAICDVDSRALAAARQELPDARTYRDFRVMLECEDQAIDAVCVSAPDHVHAAAALLAIERGKHCFCQKPLAATLAETRRLSDAARREDVVTQLGVQGLCHRRARLAIEIVRSGVLGRVREIHSWTDRPAPEWPQRRGAAPVSQPPTELDWDLWLGPVPHRPYRSSCHPGGWRGYLDLGTGALGDLGSHTLALAFVALGLGPPLSVRGEWEPAGPGLFPVRQRLILELPVDGAEETVTVFWYDGGNTPPVELVDDIRLGEHGTVLVGTEARLYLPGTLNQYLYLLPEERFGGLVVQADDAPPVADVWQEWVSACEERGVTTCDFAGFAAPLTETLLVGNLCSRLGGELTWNSSSLTVPGRPEVTELISPPRRKDW